MSGKVFILSEVCSQLNSVLAKVRDVNVQKNRDLFKHNLRRVGFLMAYEISKSLPSASAEIKTPLGTKETIIPSINPVVATVLRAGLPMQEGMLDLFTDSEAAFVSAYRQYSDEGNFDIVSRYLACPDLDGKTLIVADPMLASGKSMVNVCRLFLQKGGVSRLVIASLVASPEGVRYVQENLPEADIYLADLDEGLNPHAYILPGLGDAGDLCFGEKV